MRYVSDFFKERPPRCPDVENAENEDSERKPSLQVADTDRNHYSYSRPVWAWPLTCESTGCCSASRTHSHILYTGTDCTLFHRTTLPFHTEREREWMHELTLNIRFYTSLQTVFIPSFVLCTLIYAKCTDRLTSNEPWETLLYPSTKMNFSKGNWSFPWRPQNHRLTFTYSPYFFCWKRFFQHGKESELF